MANLVWTGILYGCTIGIVLVCYRAFMQDRRAEQQQRTRAMVDSAFVRGPNKAATAQAWENAPINQIPGVKAQTPPWARAGRA